MVPPYGQQAGMQVSERLNANKYRFICSSAEILGLLGLKLKEVGFKVFSTALVFTVMEPPYCTVENKQKGIHKGIDWVNEKGNAQN